MVVVLITLLAVASAWDAALHRIPNTLVLGIAATGLLAQFVGDGWEGLGSAALAVPAAGAALWLAWTRQWIGGGDLKLAAAAAAWLGVGHVPGYLLASAVAIGALSVACYALSARAARVAVRRNLACAAKGVAIAVPIDDRDGRIQVPAGAGFAVAALVVLAMTGGL